MNLNQNQINWIANEKLAGRTNDEIAVDTGMSVQNVKRALAEAKLISLDWYKTKEEISMLNYLNQLGINSLNKLEAQL